MTQSFSDSGKQTPRGRWVACGAALCTWGLIATRPRRPAEPPGTPAVRAAGGRRAALAAGPRPAREDLGAASAPPLPARFREDEWTPLSSPRRPNYTELTGLRDVTAPRRKSIFVISSFAPTLSLAPTFPGHEPEEAAPGPGDLGTEEAAGTRAYRGGSLEGRGR